MNEEIILNPNKEQLKTLKGIIYYIKNKITNQYYIGQTIKSFSTRYSKNNWIKKTTNNYLKNSGLKYGETNFEIAILKCNITDQNILNQEETYYANFYNAYWPNGYNFAPCGKGYDRKGSKDYFEKLGKLYEFKNIYTNTFYKIKNLSKFCRDNNLKIDSLLDNIFNIGHISKDGYCHLLTEKHDISNRYFYSRRKNLKPPFILWKNGEKYEFSDVNLFCIQNNIKSCSKILNLLEGKSTHCNFFTKENVKILPIFQKYKNIKLLNLKNNQEEFYTSATEFEIITGITSKTVSELITLKRKKSRGYKLLSYEFVN
jgi:hypothetical protein